MRYVSFFVALFSAQSFAASELEATRKVLVLSSGVKGEDHPTTMELSQEIFKRARSEGRMAPINKSLRNEDIDSRSLFSKAGLLVLDRNLLEKAIPNAQKKGETIAPVQKILDTYIADGALISLCSKNKAAAQDSMQCTVYYYDRTSARIIAAAEKVFQSGISKPREWGSYLIRKITEGLDNSQRTERTNRLVKELDRMDDSESDTKYQLRLGLRGLIHQRSSAGSSLPEFNLSLGTVDDGSFVAATVGIAQAKRGDDQESFSSLRRSFGLTAGAFARVFEKSRWEFRLEAAYTDYIRSHSYRSEDSTVRERGFLLGVGPGLLWDVTEHAFVGFQCGAHYFLPTSVQKSGNETYFSPTTILYTLGIAGGWTI